jgi:MFS family permease
VFIPLFVQGVMGTSATASGSAVTPMTLTMVISSVANGQLIARTGRYKPFAIGGFLVGVAGLIGLSALGPGASYLAVVVVMLVMGLGLGSVGPTLTLAAQSAARHSEIGVVTSLQQFARSIGNTVGTAIFGSILTLRFAPEMQAALPEDVGLALPAPVLVMTQNPQALVDPSASAALKLALAESLPSMPEATDVVFTALRAGLAGSLHWVFLAAALIFGSGFVACLFMREVPISGRQKPTSVLIPSPDLARSGRTNSPPALSA